MENLALAFTPRVDMLLLVPGTITVATARRGKLARLAHVTCTLGRRDKPYPERHHGTEWTVALVQSGTFRYRAAETNRAHALRPGWLLVGAPRAEYECSHDCDGGDRCASLTFPEAILWEVARDAGLHEKRMLATPPALPPIARVAALLHRARVRDATDVDEVAYLVAESIVAHAHERRSGDEAPHASHLRRVHDAMERIDHSCDEALSLAEIAASVGYSPFHFLRVFRRTVGTTPHQYLIAARLRRAAQMLLDTNKTITEIAFEVGFQDLSNFVRTFHRVVGSSPSAYRRR